MVSKDAVILLPSYQPEETLIVLSKALVDRGYPVLIVDDGSGEKYAPIFEKCKAWAKVISYPVNKGKGEALKVGYIDCLESFKDQKFVITADGDGQHLIQDIERVYERIAKVNMSVIGIRKFDVKVPLKSRLGNGLSKFTQSLCTLRYMKDNQCGLRAFTYEDLPTMINIKGSRYEYEMNVLTYLQMHEMPFQCITIQTIYEDNNRTTHFRPLMDTLRIQSSILLNGLSSFLFVVLEAVVAVLMCNLVFNELAFNIELSVLSAFGIAFLLRVLFQAIVYRPKHPRRMFFRILLYKMLLLLGNVVSITLFTRVLGLHLALSYLIGFFLTLFPLYYIVKGVGVVYDSQING